MIENEYEKIGYLTGPFKMCPTLILTVVSKELT